MTSNSKRLDIINEEVKKCTACSLHKQRTQTVFGEGADDARIVFCGEAPGQTEDETGRYHVKPVRRFRRPQLPCYHSSALLRNPKWKEPAWHAPQKVKSFLNERDVA